MNLQQGFDIVRLRLRSLFRRGRVESELEREFRFHLDQEIEINLRLGLPPAEARFAARRRLGGMAQLEEECRDMRRTAYIENFVQDLQYAARTLLKSPAFALAIVLTLALGIGATSAIFTVVDGVLLRPLLYPQPDRLVRIFFSSPTFPKFPLNPYDLRDIRARNRAFDGIAAITRNDRQLSGAGQPQRLSGFSVTAGYFGVLGIAPARGRAFTFADELPGKGHQVILSDRTWRGRFSADPNIVGRKITLDAEPYTVIAVMPPGFAHPGNAYRPVADGDTVDIWTPFTYRGDPAERGSHFMEAFARMQSGLSVAQAQADLDQVVAQLGREHPGTTTGWHPMVVSLYREVVSSSRVMLLVLLGAVALVLLIACANSANLLLARAIGRQREIAVRAALGAGRFRLVRQMLAESLLISLVGGAAGALVAVAGVRALTSLLPGDFPRAGAIQVNGSILAFTLLIALATGVLFGLAPAFEAARADLQQTLRESGRGFSGGARQLWLRDALVVAEVTLACVLAIGAGLMLRSFVNMLRADPGFQPQHVLTAAVSLPDATYKTGKEAVAFYNRLSIVLNGIPEVRAAGLGSDLPWTGYDDNIGGFTIEGRQPPPHQSFHARYHAATEGYFQALGTPLLRGRFFTPLDNIAAKQAVIIVNRVMAERYWGALDAVGGRITFEDRPKESDWMTVVGVVADIKDHPNSPAAEPAIWWPLQQIPFGFPEMSIVVRGRADPDRLARQVRSAVRSLDPALAVANLQSMDQIAGRSFSTPRFALFLVALFAALAATLAGIGIYGVIAYSVSQRTPEFGLRMALGAKPWDVILQVMSQGLKLAIAGIAMGIGGALVWGRILGSLLYHVSAADPVTFLSVAAATVVIAAVACYFPALRATTADPMTALRAE